MSTRNHGMEQCPKCGTWRKAGIELSNHHDSCQFIRCNGCGTPRPKHGDHYCTAAQYEAAQQAKKARLAQQQGCPPLPASPVLDVPPATQALLHTAYDAWTTRKAYIDGRGNYHVRNGQPSGPIAPWNKTVKRLYASVDLFHRAAHEWANMRQSQPTGVTL